MNWSIIKSETQYNKALKRIDEIFHPKNTKEQDEFDLLVLLINQFEETHFPIEEADPIQVLKMKMEYLGLKQKDLIPYIGSKSTVSKILSYNAPLTLKHVWVLSEELNIPIQLLAKPYKMSNWKFMKKFDSTRKQTAVNG